MTVSELEKYLKDFPGSQSAILNRQLPVQKATLAALIHDWKLMREALAAIVKWDNERATHPGVVRALESLRLKP